MAKKNVFICVKKDIVNPLIYALREFEGKLNMKFFDTTVLVEKALEGAVSEDADCCALVLDSIIADKLTTDFAADLKGKMPSLKILLIVSAGTTKEELVKIIQTKVVSGVLLRPFTAEQVSDNIYKICGFQKPTDVPWYMQGTK